MCEEQHCLQSRDSNLQPLHHQVRLLTDCNGETWLSTHLARNLDNDIACAKLRYVCVFEGRNLKVFKMGNRDGQNYRMIFQGN